MISTITWLPSEAFLHALPHLALPEQLHSPVKNFLHLIYLKDNTVQRHRKLCQLLHIQTGTQGLRNQESLWSWYFSPHCRIWNNLDISVQPPRFCFWQDMTDTTTYTKHVVDFIKHSFGSKYSTLILVIPLVKNNYTRANTKNIKLWKQIH